MADPIKVTVSDPETGEVFESRIVEDDYMLVVAGRAYLSGRTIYRTGTHVLVVKESP